MDRAIFKDCELVQIGFVVKDTEKASTAFAALVGMGPAACVDTACMDLSTWYFRGKQIGAKASIKAFRFGNIEFEFIQPYEGDSTWHEFLLEKGEGMHHFAFKVDDMHAKLAELNAAGYPTIEYGDMGGGQFAYVDGQDKIGAIIELLEFYDHA